MGIGTTTYRLLELIRDRRSTDWFDTVEIKKITCRCSLLKGHLNRLHSAKYYDVVVSVKDNGLYLYTKELNLLASFPQVDSKYQPEVKED